MERRERVNALMLRIARGEDPRPRRARASVPKRPRKVPGVDGRKRPLTLEHRMAISAANKGRRLTDEHRAKLREAHKGRPGRPQTAETKARISAARRAQYVPVMAECHPEERSWGHGKCRRCYMRDWKRERRAHD